MQVTGSDGAAVRERSRAEAVGESLAGLTRQGETWGELAHDARNLMTALSLYCDLLEEPGVLAEAHGHYGCELRLVAEASRRLVEKLALFGDGADPGQARERGVLQMQGRLFSDEGPETGEDAAGVWLERRMRRAEPARIPAQAELVEDLREELLASRELLAALAGPSIRLTVVAQGGARGVRLTSEELLRVLVNLVRNAAESIAGAGTIVLSLDECLDAADGLCPRLLLTAEDSGPGIAAELLEKVFERGFTTRAGRSAGDGWASSHRGLGLAISRSLVEGAGGRIYAENNSPGGARFVIELPVRAESSRMARGLGRSSESPTTEMREAKHEDGRE